MVLQRPLMPLLCPGSRGLPAIQPGWGLGEGKGEATCPSQPALALPAPAGGFKRSGILRLGILVGASYILLHLDFFQIGFLFCNKKRKKEQNLKSDFCSLFLYVLPSAFERILALIVGRCGFSFVGCFGGGGGTDRGLFNPCVLSRKWEFVISGWFSSE